MRVPDHEPRLTAGEYLATAPGALGGIEIVSGLVVRNMAQSELHDLAVRFGEDRAKVSEIEEYRLDWPGRRYAAYTVHRRALILDEPLRLTMTLDDSWRHRPAAPPGRLPAILRALI